MNYNQMLIAVAAIGIGAPTQPALAAPVITVAYSGSADFGSGPVGYYNGSVVPNPNSSTSLVQVGIGGDSFTTANEAYNFSATGQFNAWCVDIYHWLAGGTVTYNVGTGNDLAAVLASLRPGSPDGATRVIQLVQLADEAYSLVDTKTESAAFQLAVWAITYGTSDSSGHYHINATDVDFRVDIGTVSSPFGQLANAWLANLGTAPNTGNYTLTYLNDGTRNSTQDMIVFTDPPLNVPEPASIALLSLGLAGLKFSRRKRA